jgi:hypothetical protein
MTKYTLTFDYKEESKFRQILSRLDESEYIILEDLKSVDESSRYSDKQVVMEIDSESCLTFRMGMSKVIIRREKSEEELAAEKERDERHKIHINVTVPKDNSE